MKFTKNLSFLFLALLFAVSSTAIGADCKQAKVPIGQSIEDVYTAVPAAGGNHDCIKTFSIFSSPWITGAFILGAGITAYAILPDSPNDMILGMGAIATSAKSAKLARVRSAFPGVPTSVITEHYLQKEIATENTKNLYEFNFNGSSNDVVFQTENLLGKNNVFVCTDIWYGLAYEPASTSDFATRYYTWPNYLNFVTTASATQNDLENFWNARYEVKTGLMVIPPKTTRDHYFAPTNDQKLWATGGSTAASNRAGQIQGFSSGFVSQEPMIMFSGAASQSINLTVGTGFAVDWTADAGQIRVVFKLNGFIVFNGAQSDSIQGKIVQQLMNEHKGILPV